MIQKGEKMLKKLLLATTAILFIGCTDHIVITTPKPLPVVYKDLDQTQQQNNTITVSLFKLENYTDTPRAGMRAANLLEGILKSKGYNVISHVNEKSYTLQKAAIKAENDEAQYFIYGGVSEWRYKTGIDGEPAVSIQISLYDTQDIQLVWSATGSDSDWGNGSIGTTAQELLMEMTNN
jgi:polysaccharide biosynthesis protein PelC